MFDLPGWKYFCAGAAVYIVIASLLAIYSVRVKKIKFRIWREAGKFAFFLYAAALLPLLVWPRFDVPTLGRLMYVSYNILPFRSIVEYVGLLANHAIDLGTVVMNIAGNVVIFIPFGMLAPAIWPGARRFWKCLLLGAMASVGVELAQLLFTVLGMLYRSADIDDVILNAAGAAAGYGLFALARLVTAPLRTGNKPA